MRTRRTSMVCGMAVLLAAGLAACGSAGSSRTTSSGSGSGGPGMSGSSPTTHSGGQASTSPTKVLADAKSALFNAKAVHVTGTITDHAQHEKIDLRFQGQDTAGTETLNGMVVHLVKVGATAYLKAPASFWTRTAGPKAAALAGQWIKSPGASGLSSLTLQSLAASINATDSPLRPGVKRTSLHGAKAVVLTQKDGSMIYIADATPPVPLRIINKHTHAGHLDFTDYGKTQHITAPQGAVTAKQALQHRRTPATA